MRRSPEILILLVLLLVGIGGVLWYVIDRRARLAVPPPPATAQRTEPVPLAGQARHEAPAIDFPGSQPWVKNDAEAKAYLDSAAKELADASKGVTFEAPGKKPVPSPAPPRK